IYLLLFVFLRFNAAVAHFKACVVLSISSDDTRVMLLDKRFSAHVNFWHMAPNSSKPLNILSNLEDLMLKSAAKMFVFSKSKVVSEVMPSVCFSKSSAVFAILLSVCLAAFKVLIIKKTETAIEIATIRTAVDKDIIKAISTKFISFHVNNLLLRLRFLYP